MSGRNGDRILDHAALEALDLGYLRGLRLGGHVLVNDADAAFLRQSNRQARFGHGIHRGRHQRDIQGNFAGQPGGEADVAGQNVGMGGDQQDIVEGQRFLQNTHVFILVTKAILYKFRASPVNRLFCFLHLHAIDPGTLGPLTDVS